MHLSSDTVSKGEISFSSSQERTFMKIWDTIGIDPGFVAPEMHTIIGHIYDNCWVQ